MERQQIVYDGILWLSLLSIVAICLLMFYDGVTGLARVPSADLSVLKKAFSATVFVLFIALPLMILNLMLETAFTSDLFGWSTSVIYVFVAADIVLMTILYLIM